jgi:hypothetical protein
MKEFPVPKEVIKYYGYEQKYLSQTDKTLVNCDRFYEKKKREKKKEDALRGQLVRLLRQQQPTMVSDNKEVYIFEAEDGKIYAAMWKDLIFRLGSVDDIRDY